MKEFNAEKFCKDLIALRGKEAQNTFAQKLKINRSTLSLLENGKQMPVYYGKNVPPLWRNGYRKSRTCDSGMAVQNCPEYSTINERRNWIETEI